MRERRGAGLRGLPLPADACLAALKPLRRGAGLPQSRVHLRGAASGLSARLDKPAVPAAAIPRPPARSVELVRWSERDKGAQKTVGHARSIFNSAFGGCRLLPAACCLAPPACDEGLQVRRCALLASAAVRTLTPPSSAPTLPHSLPLLHACLPAAPLVMDNGRNLIDMVCEAYESPDPAMSAPGGAPGAGSNGGGAGGAEEEEEQPPAEYNFSEAAA